MNPKRPLLPLTRREFIHRSGVGGLGLLAFSGYVPGFLARASAAQAPLAEKDRTILVLVQLAGGNDGLNTIIPHTDDHYYNLRPRLGLRNDLLPINDHLAFHPACRSLHRLFNDGNLAILQNVGYPNPNRSHFRSSEIWETATDSDTIGSTGWLGRYFDNTCCGTAAGVDHDNETTSPPSPDAIHVGDVVPQTFSSRQQHSLFGLPRRRRPGSGGNARVDAAYEALLKTEASSPEASFLQHTMMNVLVTERRIQEAIAADRTSVQYPNSALAQSLKRIAALIHADLETRVYFVSQGGYDTHANQLDQHARLLGDLSTALSAFQADLRAKKRDQQVLTVTFSEFGRRADENAGAGTDHGAAAPLFVMGSAVKGGVHGHAPILRPNAREVDFSTDFRSVYSRLLSEWFETDPTAILGRSFDGPRFI